MKDRKNKPSFRCEFLEKKMTEGLEARNSRAAGHALRTHVHLLKQGGLQEGLAELLPGERKEWQDSRNARALKAFESDE